VGCDGRIRRKKQRIDKSAAGMAALFLWAMGLYSWGFSVCEPAREDGLTVNMDIECAGLIASKLAPTGTQR
jgi:hypothetical protein